MRSSTVSPRRVSVRNNTKKLLQAIGMAMAVLLVCVPAFSQSAQGNIQGAVFDQSGGAIAGAMVTVTDVARGISRNLVADATGQYVATSVNPGTYTIRAEAKGFQALERSGVLVEVGQTVRVDMVLQPGEQTQTITVSGEAPAINTTDAVMGGAVSNTSIVELPLNGRNFERLLQLRPGVVSLPGAGTGTDSTNGGRLRNSIYRMEGIAGISNTGGSGLLNYSYGGGDSNSLVPIDAIQEFSSTQNAKAEAGWKDGNQVNIGIKSGTNSLHGTAYAFGRDAGATDGTNFFTHQVTQANLEQFGATAGGRIIKDKLFWFAGGEFVRDTTGSTSTVTAPTVSGNGVGTSGNVGSWTDTCLSLGYANLNPLSVELAGINPDCSVHRANPGVAGPAGENIFPYITGTSTTFFPNITQVIPVNNGIGKIDYAINDKNHLSGMVFIARSFSNTTQNAAVMLPQYNGISLRYLPQYSGSWTWTPSSTWVNDFRAGYIYVTDQLLPADQSMIPGNPWPSGYGFPTGVIKPLYGGLPTIKFNSFSGVVGNDSGSLAIGGPQGSIDIADSVSYLRGNHAFKFGFEYLRMIFDRNRFNGAQGIVPFASLSTFLMGSPTTGGSILLGNELVITRQNWYAGFFQDDWRLTPKVTLNLGMRYEIYACPTVRDNYLGNFDPNVNPATTSAVQQVGPGAPIVQCDFKTNYNDIAPRTGVAWDIQGNGKTVLRAGGNLLRDADILGEYTSIAPFGASIPSIGVNYSNTAISANTPVTLGITPVQFHWNTAANLTAGQTVFPNFNNPVTIDGVNYTGPTCTINGNTPGTVADTAPGFPGFTAQPCQVSAIDSNFRQAYTVAWNLDIQRAITNNITLDVGYVGNHGFNQETYYDLNQPPVGAGWAGAPATACIASAPNYTTSTCKPSSPQELAGGLYTSLFPYLSNIDLATTGDFSNYAGLQTTLQARNFHGLTFLTAYTYAHALSFSDNNSIVSNNILPTDKNNLRLDYGASSYDLRHRFIFSPTYNIPGIKSPGQMLEGWSVNGILTLQSGLPITVSTLTAVDFLGTGQVNNNNIGNGALQFWNYTGSNRSVFAYNTKATAPTHLTGAKALATCQTAATAPYGTDPTATNYKLAIASLYISGCWLSNGGILTPPAYGTVGDAGTGFFRAAHYFNLDFSIAKVWKFKERYSAQFRFETFNTFNHTDYASPLTTDPTNASFGYSQSTPDTGNTVLGSGGPRHIQFGLKLAF